MAAEKHTNAQYFLDLIRRSKKGNLKIYIGMSAGVGKTYRMLQEAHTLSKNGINVQIGYIETHDRIETRDLLNGLHIIPRKKIFYKGKEIEEMDLDAILLKRPEVVIVDELAHSNIEGSKNAKRWQDVVSILDAGINVISAVNIQHLESLHQDILEITGIDITERIPDSILSSADEVVNIDLTADELIMRLREGKIYRKDKVDIALKNFFQRENILQLRELALREVALQVERKVEQEVTSNKYSRKERFLACISSNEMSAKNVIRKTARLANYYNSTWFVLYIQTPSESPDAIPLDKQRYLINNFKLANELGAELIKTEFKSVTEGILEQAKLHNITTVCIGRPRIKPWAFLYVGKVYNTLLKKITDLNIDIIILS